MVIVTWFLLQQEGIGKSGIIRMKMKSRIFISCGQHSHFERDFAAKLKTELEALGFIAYYAVADQTMESLKNNILNKISESEYFIFIDFKRERILSDWFSWRGSLFVQQELAVAAYLKDKRILAFQEKGVLKRDGMIGSMQLNLISFLPSERKMLLGMIIDEVNNRLNSNEWSNNWRDELRLIPSGEMAIENSAERGRHRFFHIRVENFNPYRPATFCSVFLKSVTRVATNETENVNIVEYKWRGCNIPYITIPPLMSRDFDAYIINESAPTFAIPVCFNDGSIHHIHALAGPSDFRLIFSVVSQTFPSTNGEFLFHIDNDFERSRMEIT